LKFRAKSENELSKLSDEDLVAHLVAARDADHREQVSLATGIFVFGRYDMLLGLAGLKLGNDEDIQDIVQETIADTLDAAFRGHYVGELVSLMKTILNRRIADFYLRKSREPGRVGPGPDGRSPLDDMIAPEDLNSSVTQAVIDQVLGTRSARDRSVVVMKLGGFTSKEIADVVSSSLPEGTDPLTWVNVDKINSRFRQDLRIELYGDDTRPGTASDGGGSG
jgi:DNA-directed RNA polymerase specialized sigma24 family protein